MKNGIHKHCGKSPAFGSFLESQFRQWTTDTSALWLKSWKGTGTVFPLLFPCQIGGSRELQALKYMIRRFHEPGGATVCSASWWGEKEEWGGVVLPSSFLYCSGISVPSMLWGPLNSLRTKALVVSSCQSKTWDRLHLKGGGSIFRDCSSGRQSAVLSIANIIF